MIGLWLLAVAAQNPDGASFGFALSRCASLNLVKYDDGASAPATIARKAVRSCTAELAAMRAAMQQIAARSVDPKSPAAKEAIAERMTNITVRFEKGVAAEIQKRRGGAR